MSRVGKQPIIIPEKVKVTIDASKITAEGPLGNLSFEMPKGVKAVQEEKNILVEIEDANAKNAMAMYGTSRARINNLVIGVSTGFLKVLEIKGLGYRANIAGNKINLELGFSHPVNFEMPKGISAEVDAKKNTLTIKGADKVLVGDLAAKIKRLRPPEPYKGSGIKYAGEHIARKAGKSASAGAKK